VFIVQNIQFISLPLLEDLKKEKYNSITIHVSHKRWGD